MDIHPSATEDSSSETEQDQVTTGNETSDVASGKNVSADHITKSSSNSELTVPEERERRTCNQCMSVQEEPVNKEQCLKLIDEIWKEGLDYRLSVMRRHRLLRKHWADTHLCDDCMRQQIEKSAEMASANPPMDGDESSGGESGKETAGDKSAETHSPKLAAESSGVESGDTPTPHSAKGSAEGHQRPVLSVASAADGRKSSDSDSDTELPPFKKARYGWQIKNSLSRTDNTLELKDDPTTERQGQTSSSTTASFCKDKEQTLRKRKLAATSEKIRECSGSAPQEAETRCASPFPQVLPPAIQPASSVCIPAVDISISEPETAVHDSSTKSDNSAGSKPVVSINVQAKTVSTPNDFQSLSELTTSNIGRRLPLTPAEDVMREASRVTMERYPSGRRPTTQDFHTLSRALGRLTYMERWQCQHVAKAIVDNAINKTLEEMGLSPNPDSGQYQRQRTRIEDAGVSHAIRQQGLQRYPPDRMQRLNPIINRLTQVSENLFSQNLRRQVEETGDNTGQGSRSSDVDSMDEQTLGVDDDLSSSPLSSSDNDNNDDKKGDDVAPDQLSPLQQEIPIKDNSSEGQQTPHQPMPPLPDTEETEVPPSNVSPSATTVVSDSPASLLTHKHLTEPATAPTSAPTTAPTTADSTPDPSPDRQADIVAIETSGPSASFLLDQAVNAAIYEQGLHLS